MTAQSWLLLAVYLVVLLAAVKPLGLYMTKLMEAPRWQPLARLENGVFRLSGIGVRRNGALTGNDLADSLRGNADLLGQTILAKPRRLEELLQQNLARGNGFEFAHHLSGNPRSPCLLRPLPSSENRCATDH